MRRTSLIAVTLSVVMAVVPTAFADDGRPWTVPVERPTLSRDLTFERAGARLSGTLFYPADDEPHRAAAVMMRFALLTPSCGWRRSSARYRE